MKFNGNELVLDPELDRGVAGIAADQPDSLGFDIALGYNLMKYINSTYWDNPEDAIGAIRKFISNNK